MNRLHGQGPNAGDLLTDEEYFMLMEYVLQEKQIQFATYSALLSNYASNGRPVADADFLRMK